MKNKAINNILFFNSHYAWGGGEKWHLEMARLLDKDGYSVSIVAGVGSELAQRAAQVGLPFIEVSVGRLSFLNPFQLLKFYFLFRRNVIKSVVLNLPSDLKVAGLAAKLAGVPRIIYRRGSAIPVRNTWLNRFFFRYVLTGVIANSEETKRTILAKNSQLIPHEKIHVIYNGIDLEHFDSTTRKLVYLNGRKEYVLGHVGRLSSEKNQKFMIDVIDILKKNDIKCRLLIAGTGPLEEDLKQYTREKGLQEEVVFLGFQDDIPSFMSSIDIFLLSSLWEGFGYVLVEAMAAGKPIVAFQSSSTPEIVKNGVTGYLVEKNDINNFALKVKELCFDFKKRKQFGRAGRLRVEKHFTNYQALKDFKKLLNI